MAKAAFSNSNCRSGPAVDASLQPMEARLVTELPKGGGWQFEPKWDGFRCLAFKAGDEVELHAKSGKPLGRYFPEVVAAALNLPEDDFVLDGELVIPVDGVLSFGALQLRLHPAESRIRKLSRETPAILVVFDMLMKPGGESIVASPLVERRAALEAFMERARASDIRLSPYTRKHSEAATWLEGAGGAIDGVVAKRLDEPYRSGERAMSKVKNIRTADCVVGGFRYASGSDQVGSLLLGLFSDHGELDHVGFTSGIGNAERPALTRKLERLKGPPGFTGRAPGGPSRWATERTGEWEPLRHELVVEVAYDHVTGDRFRHGTRLLRWRPDKAPAQCTFEQIAPPAGLMGW